MRRWAGHLINELRLRWALTRRYAFQSLLGLALLLGLFGGLLALVVGIGGKGLDSGALDGLLLGFVLWQFAAGAYAAACADLAEEARQRTLEALCVAPPPLAALLGLRALLQLGGSLLLLAAAYALVGWLSDGRLQLQSGRALLPVLLAAPALLGLGYASAGVLLLAKRAEALPALGSLALMGLVALPATPHSAWALLPYALGAQSARALAAGAALDPAVLGLIALNSALYLGLGLGAFALAQRQARRLGILGHG